MQCSMKIKSIVILGASGLLSMGDTQLPPIPLYGTNTISQIKLNSNFVLDSSSLEQTEVVTNWQDRLPPSYQITKTGYTTSLTVNSGFEYGQLVTNHFINVIHQSKMKKVILSSETNEFLIFERQYFFQRVYTNNPFVIQQGR